MKKLQSLIICLLCGLTLFGQTDTVKVDFTESFASPLLFLHGSNLNVQADSVFVMNAPRYRFYRDLHETYLQKNTIALSELVLDRYEASLIERDSFFTLLFVNNWETELRMTKMENEWRSLQKNLQQTLTTSEILLKSSNQRLVSTTQTLKKSNRKSKLEKILIGSAGIGIGALVGLIFL
jgi:hypothetical protein